MWKAYYAKSKFSLSWELIKLLRNQFGISFFEALRTGRFMALSAIKFKSGGENYNTALPDLIKAYINIRRFSGLKFDPEKTAKASLAWWIARRTKGENSTKQIGEKISIFYENVYGYKHPAFDRAGQLRASAAHVRDVGKDKCDWSEVESILLLSYKELLRGVEVGYAKVE